MFEKQADFPLIKQYKKKFKIDENTIFAYDNKIYTNQPLYEDIFIHEQTHLRRQNKIGVDKWVEKYLNDNEFRLKEELIAFREQLKSIKNREVRNKIRLESAKILSSELYGQMISHELALKLLR